MELIVAHVATVKFENGTSKAIGIENLDIDGTLYNVAFTSTGTVAVQVYGIIPGQFDFSLATTATTAINAVNFELNKADATGVGAEGSGAVPFFWVGFDSEMGVDPQIEIVFVFETIRGEVQTGANKIWVRIEGATDSELYNFGQGVWAGFTPVPIPAAVWLLGSGLIGLLGLRKRFKR